MQVIGGKNRPFPLLEPGVDFLQERGIDQAAGERVIDTQYDFVPGVYTRLNGRKYVGENTVRELGKLIGLVDAGEAQATQDEFEAYKANVAQALEGLRGFSDVLDKLLANAPVSTRPPLLTPADAEAHADLAAERQVAEEQQIAASQTALNDAQTPPTFEEALTAAAAAAEEPPAKDASA